MQTHTNTIETENIRDHAAVVIQTTYRSYSAREEWLQRYYDYTMHREKMKYMPPDIAAHRIQSLFRSYLGVVKNVAIHDQARRMMTISPASLARQGMIYSKHDERQVRAATLIQCQWRCHLARAERDRRRAEKLSRRKIKKLIDHIVNE
eukprot:PhF_6_TR19721/c0_g1_i1/m.28787